MPSILDEVAAAGIPTHRLNWHYRSRDEALEWTRRFPNPRGEGLEAEIEVRQLYEMEDFAGVDGVEQFRDLETLRG